MTNEEIKEIIEKHRHWLNEDCEGWEDMNADLRGADLRGADLSEADLEESHKMEVEQLLIEIAELQKQVHDYAQCLYVIQARADKESRHSKYKRSLAMAEWCNSGMVVETFACFRPRSTKEVWKEEHKYWAKWRKIWFELAKHYKEAK